MNEAATASDAKGAAAIEARLLTTVLNGSEDSPVTNVRIVVKNIGANFYTYVSGWATFYDSSAVRCGEGLFKLDALAPNESAEVDTPGLRLHCSPASWRIVATNLPSRTAEGTKPIETAPPPSEAVTEKSAPINFVISIDGERELGPNFSVGVKGIYRNYGRVVEDFLCAADGTYCIGNPGEGIMKQVFTLDYVQGRQCGCDADWIASESGSMRAWDPIHDLRLAQRDAERHS